MSSGYGDEGRKGARSNALEHLSRTRSDDMGRLSNGNTRKESPRMGSRGRHKQQPSTMEFLANGDVQMMCEPPDDVMNTSTNSNPRNGTIHETAEKPRRTARNRIHHHQEGSQQMRNGGREDRISTMKLVSAGSGNLRVPDSPGGNTKSSSTAIDDLNRIHQRLHQSAEARESPQRSLVVENGVATRPGVVVDVREHLEDRLRQRRSNSNRAAATDAQSFHVCHDVRQDGSRVPSHRSSMQSSGDRSPHKQQPTHRNVNYQSSYEREEQSAERDREPLTERSTPQIISPSKQHSRLQLLASYRSSYEGDEPQSQNSRNGNVVPSEQRGRARDTGVARRGPKSGQTW